MRSRHAAPFGHAPARRPAPASRAFARLLAGTLLICAVLASSAAPGYAPPRLDLSPPDSDSVAVLRGIAAPPDSVLPEMFIDQTGAANASGADRVDGDTVAVSPTAADTITADTTSADMAVADSVRSDALSEAGAADSSLVDRYLGSLRRDGRSASLFQRKTRPFSARLSGYWKHEVALDSASGRYVARETVGGEDVRDRVSLDFERYRRERLRRDVTDAWYTLAERSAQQRANQRRGGLGVNIVVPGGRQSAFSTIFGKPEVDLRVTGQAYIQAGFDRRKSDQQAALTGGSGARTDPTFKQDLSLGITGSIGDKLRVDVSWDTKNQFDYQNQLKLVYTGYEDEIIQKIEAGNVFLQTPSTLIRGGQSLFGIKSELQLGGIRVTTVASQQEGQSNSLSIDGGSQSKEFNLRPTDYDDSKHFFLGYFFRNQWEPALTSPPTVIRQAGFDQIEQIEVWKLDATANNATSQNDSRQIVAMVDLGEQPTILDPADGGSRYTRLVLPSADIDQYDEGTGEIDAQLRDGNSRVDTFLTSVKGLNTKDFETGRFRRLSPNDYSYDRYLGYITLKSRLSEGEALAVAYSFRSSAGVRQIGDFLQGGSEGGQNEDRLVLKLLRPSNITPPPQPGETGYTPAAWFLELRNIYSLQSYGINPNEFDLEVYYEPPGKTPEKTIPGIGRAELLALLGLDRLNADGAPGADYEFDYIPDYTIEPSQGLLIFPYLEPFGNHIDELITESENPELQNNRDRYVFSNLYTLKKERAKLNKKLDIYTVRGSYKGSVQSFYDLGAYAGLIPGSVRVTSGGTPLTEGLDFDVDYQSGSVSIKNPAYLSAGRAINITYEQNQFFNFQKKTLVGVRADYVFDERFAMGATMMSLNQKSPVDKFRLGDEPVSNTIWGVDGAIDLEPRWLTRAIDFLPLIQTKAPSAISVTGEFAQLRPNHVETIAFDRTRRDLRDAGRDFTRDELRGVSYVDDFEGFENTYSLKMPSGWQLSAAPDSIPVIDGVGRQSGADSLRTNWRGTLAWYTLGPSSLDGIDASVFNPLSISQVLIDDVYDREMTGETDRYLPTLDFYFNPLERGPYNYTRDLKAFLNHPAATWGGMTQRLPDGYNDFNLKNIEFVEMIIRPFAENEANDAGPEARLLVDLGTISEDVIPNGKLNLEDGLSTTTANPNTIDDWSRLSGADTDNAITIKDGRTEDLGLDGLASYNPDAYRNVPPNGISLAEQDFYADFLASLDPNDPDPRYRAEVARALIDPSNDDYIYFRSGDYFNDDQLYPRSLYPNGPTVQQRFSHYFPGLELNSFEGQNRIGNRGQKTGNSRYPDTEDLNLNSRADVANNYFEYEIPLSLAALQEQARPENQDDYVVTELTKKGTPTGWYQVRIPVQQFTRRFGTINNFDLIESIRLWTTGHKVPATVRIAAIELVGSQWQKAGDVTGDLDSLIIQREARFTVSSINNEENANVYKPPSGAVVSQTRLASGSARDAREQSMLMRVEDLHPGNQRAIYKTFQGLDLLKYDFLRMFVHMHGRLADGTDLAQLAETNMEEARSKAVLFVRLGSNQTDDYYEYEQPLTPSAESAPTADLLWRQYEYYGGKDRPQDLNSLGLRLSALNQLKVQRDLSEAVLNRVFWSSENGVRTPGAPDVEEFAPPGTRIGVKGNPSLGKINTVVIGLRHPGGDYVIEDITLWVNELRTAGYDETNGWAGLVNASFKLADLGNFKFNMQRQTDGFGELASTLDERQQTNISNWGFNSDVNLDKFIPERYGWSLPLSFQMQSNTTTPRYSPTRGDVRLEEELARIDALDVSSEDRDLLRREVMDNAQTHSLSQSFTARIAKTGSDSWLLRNTLDALSLNYNYANGSARTPSQKMNDSWRWSGTAGYRVSIRKPRTVKPLWFMQSLPLIGSIGGINFNYAPQAISFTASASRNFSESQQRRVTLRGLPPGQMEYLALNPIRQVHSFGHRRNFSLQYNPFNFLNLNLQTNTDQNLNARGVDTLHSAIRVFGNEQDGMLYEGSSVRDLVNRGILTDSTAQEGYDVTRLRVRPAGSVLGSILTGNGPRTEAFSQQFGATFQPNLSKVKALSWFNLQPVGYNVTYRWQNGPAGQLTGATVANSVDLKTGFSLKPQEFWKKFAFYRTIEQEQRAAEQAKKQARQLKLADRQRRSEERKREREAEAKRREAEDALRAQGIEPPVDSTALAEAALEDTTSRARRPVISLPKPNPLALLRRAFLAVTGVRDLNVTYSNTQSATSSGVGVLSPDGESVSVGYNLLDAVRGDGPGLGYRFGFDRHIDTDKRLLNVPSLRIRDDFTTTEKLLARTTIMPSPALSINLNWNVDWGTRENIALQMDEFNNLTQQINTTGDNRASIWAFGASYLDLFKRQRVTFEQDRQAASGNQISDDNGDGRVAAASQSVVDDFMAAYLKGPGTLGGRGLLPFPMPSWNMTYSGFGNWPIVRSLVQSASLKHGYSADYSTGYATNIVANAPTVNLGRYVVQYESPEYKVNTVRVSERFSPLIGADFSFKGRVQTSVAWNKTSSYTLTPGTNVVGEVRTNEITATAGYQRQGMNIPFLPGKRLNNRISFNLAVSWAANSDVQYRLNTGLIDLINRPETFQDRDVLSGDNVSRPTDIQRLTIAPKISYQFSNRVSADFTLRRENFIGDGRQPSYTNTSGNFNIRVSISN